MSIITKSDDEIDLPKNYTAHLFGTATTGGWTQEVRVRVLDSEGAEESEHVFKAFNSPLVVTSGGSGIAKQQDVVLNADNAHKRTLKIIFRVFKNKDGTGDADKILGYYKDVHTPSPVACVTNYTYRTEDGGDTDYHDTAFVVSLIKDIK
ncbi:hypothetical protein M405DRAFT_388117 [Rhizopogon salebrosus TDB-379]|nr:hypothetical protein M405DRAFT_388117 [Rhizopogon salebrosus TDB-379]